jgi:hypothetical protein
VVTPPDPEDEGQSLQYPRPVDPGRTLCHTKTIGRMQCQTAFPKSPHRPHCPLHLLEQAQAIRTDQLLEAITLPIVLRDRDQVLWRKGAHASQRDVAQLSSRFLNHIAQIRQARKACLRRSRENQSRYRMLKALNLPLIHHLLSIGNSITMEWGPGK